MIQSRDEATLADTAFIFPGQGSQQPGMGKEFYETWLETRDAFDELDAALEIDLYDRCFRSESEALTRPRNAQPALLAVGYATYAGISTRFGIEPAFVAGHSLGHFTSLAAADVAPPVDLVTVVRQRGTFMERAEQLAGPGTMVAVLLTDPDSVADACRTRDDVGVALYNGPRQTVISGTIEGIEAVQGALSDSTTVRFRELEVGAAFHSPVMASAVEPITEVMTELAMDEATIPIVSDVSGEAYTDPDIARQDLTTQITSAVNWVSVVEELKRRDIERYVEFPPAGVLTGLIERIQPEAECYALETPADAREVFA